MFAAAWAAFKGSKLFGYLALAVAIVGGLLILVGRLMGAGRDKERAEEAARTDALRRQADETRNAVDSASDSNVDKLRDRWTRQ